METIRFGKLPEGNTPWWAGKKVQCGTCAAIFKLTIGDAQNVETTAERHPGGMRTIAIRCGTHGCTGMAKYTSIGNPVREAPPQ